MSFGPEPCAIELGALNVIIGPNGSGKSNLIEVINLMRATPKDLREVARRSGGAMEWIWKGLPQNVADVALVFASEANKFDWLKHQLIFWGEARGFSIYSEEINAEWTKGNRAQLFKSELFEKTVILARKKDRTYEVEEIDTEDNQSILAQRRDPDVYFWLSWMAQRYERIRLYREWTFGRNAIFRTPQSADMRNDVLEEDFSNLGLFLNRLRIKFPAVKRAIITALQDLYDGITDFEISVEGGTVQVFFMEGDFVIPATRLSDGTLRYLCLLAILCDPEPPPLVCLEEPELGLHPDILPKIADLMAAFSQRAQLIVTTHSDVLIDAMTDRPESVLVCEKHEGKTTFQRLQQDELQDWLKQYRLGEIWTKGLIGGTRW